jgi:hypothetical protein
MERSARLRLARRLGSVAALCLLAGATGAAAAVPAPFAPLVVSEPPGAVQIQLWNRSYRFDAGPLPAEIRARGSALLVARPRLRAAAGAGARDIVWKPPVILWKSPEEVRLRSVGSLPGLQAYAETTIEYDGMIDVTLRLTASRALQLEEVSYQLALAPGVAQLYAHHLPYAPSLENVDKGPILSSAGALPASLSFDYVPTLALGNRHVGIEWWSESNANWSPRAGSPSQAVSRAPDAVRLDVTPIRTPIALAQGQSWSDVFTLFVFPSRPPRERWRSVRFVSYSRVWSLDPNVGSRFVYLATQSGFHARHDGLPASIDDSFQRSVRSELARLGVGYMPYGMLMVAPLMHPRTLSSYELWATNRWWRLQPGWTHPVLERNHPQLAVGDPYTYSACAGRSDYFDWILDENLRAVRNEGIDALYFDQGLITRMCLRSPALVGKPNRQIWEYRNVRRFYKRLYEALAVEAPDTLVTMHTHGTPKAVGAFVDYHVSGEALNGIFGAPHPATVYFSDPSVYKPDYFALPESYLDAQLFPPVGGVSSLIPQVRWAIDPADPARARRYQRGMHGIVLSNDLHAPVWGADTDAVLEIYRALDRFGDLSDAQVSRWFQNTKQIVRPAGVRATAWVRGGRAALVLVNPAATTVRGRVDLSGWLTLTGARRYRDLEVEEAASQPLASGGFDVTIPPRDLRILEVE